MVTEFIEGETLRHALRRGALPMRDVLDIGVQLAGALAAAHARGLVHRDIKPENVMVRRDGCVKVLDFGLAKFATVTQSPDQVGVESHTQPGMVIGTRATCRRSRRAASTSTHAATSGVSGSCSTKWQPAGFPSPTTAPRLCSMSIGP